MENDDNKSLIKRENLSLSRLNNQLTISDKLLHEYLKLIPFHYFGYWNSDDRWGFCKPDKTIVIPCDFLMVEPFQEGLALVLTVDRKYQFIDKKGDVIIDLSFKYREARSFQNSLAAVKSSETGLWGFIDKIGNEAICCSFYEVGEFSGNLVPVCKQTVCGRIGHLDEKSRELTSDKNVICPYGDIKKIYNNHCGLHIDFWGFMGKNGEEVVPCKYEVAGSWQYTVKVEFTEGLTWVLYTDLEAHGYYNEHGHLVFPDYSFSERKYGCFDNNGILRIPFLYDAVHEFSEGLAGVRKDCNSEWIFVDMNGNEVFQLEKGIESSSYGFREGLCGCLKNGKYGFIDKTGREVISNKYDWGGYFSDGLCWVVLDGKGGFIDNKGNEVISLQYSDGYNRSFQEGLAGVSIKHIDKQGKTFDDLCFINKEGEIVIPFLGFDIGWYVGFYDGLCLLQYFQDTDYLGKNIYKNYGYIDNKGNRFWKWYDEDYEDEEKGND